MTERHGVALCPAVCNIGEVAITLRGAFLQVRHVVTIGADGTDHLPPADSGANVEVMAITI